MAEPQENISEEEELEMLRLQKARAQANIQKAEQNRIAARSAANDQTPDFNREADPFKQKSPLARIAAGGTHESDAGITNAADSYLFKLGNALTFDGLRRAGNQVVPGKELGNRAVRAADSYPLAGSAGQMTGMGVQVVAGGHALAPFKGLPLIKQGVDAIGRTRLGSYAGRMAKDMGLWTGESAIQGATTLAGENAAYTGQEPTMSDRAQMAQDVATMDLGDLGVKMPFVKDIPLNVGGPLVMSGLARTGTLAATGGRTMTPQNVRHSVAEGQGRQSVNSREIPEALDAVAVSRLRPQALDGVARILERSGLAGDDVRALAAEVSKRIESATGAAARKTVAEHMIDVVDSFRPQVTETIIQQLRELRMRARPGQNSPGIVRAVTSDQTQSQVPFLSESAGQNIGTGASRLESKAQIAAEKKAIGQRYDQALAGGAMNNQAVLNVVNGPNMNSLMKPLREMAGAEGLDIDGLIARNPAAAAHWMAWKAGTLSRNAPDKVTRGNYKNMRKRFLKVLDDNVEGYKGLRSEYADQFEFEAAVSFGDKLFGSGASKTMNNVGLQDELIEGFFELSPQAQELARNSIRDAAMAPLRGGPEEAAARLTALKSTSALEFFERIGANQFADDIRAIRDEQMFVRAIDPDANSRSLPNAIALEDAPAMRNSTLANMASGNQGAGTDMLIGAGASTLPGIGPWAWLWPARRMVAGANKTVFQTRTDTLDDISRFLMMRKGDTVNSPVNRIGRVQGQNGLAAHLAREAGSDEPSQGPSGPAGGTPPPSGGGAPPAGGSPLPMKSPANSGEPGPDFPFVVRHDDGQEWGFKTREEAEAFARENTAGSPLATPAQNGLFGFGRKPQAQQPINRAAAVRYNGRTVSGWNDHESALVELDEMFGGARVPRDQVEFGFVGNDGQFVSRTDQGLLLDLLNNNQLTPEATRLAQKAIRNGDEFTITAEMITEPRSRSNGLPMLNNPTTGGAVLGGMAGGTMAQDLDGDGRVSMQERYAQGSLGALAGGLGGRAVGKLDDRMISQGSRQVLEGRAAPSSMGISKQTNKDYFGQPLENIFDQEAKGFSTLTDSATNGRLKVVERPDGWSSIIETYVPSESRRQGAGSRLLQRALDDYPNLQGSFTSEQSIKNAFRLGMRDANNPGGSLEDALRVYADEGQVLLRSNGGKMQGALPMDEASRLARAREMGFDTEQTLYHGTTRGKQLAESNQFELGRGGSGGIDQGEAVFLSNNPQVSNTYAPVQKQLTRDEMQAIYDQGEAVVSVDTAMKWQRMNETNPAVFPLVARGKIKEIDKAAITAADGGFSDTGMVRLIDQAKREGYEGLRIKGSNDGVDVAADEYVIFNPKNLRSRYATFDPAQSDSPVLTAGIGGRRRKDVMRDVLPESQGARVPGTQKPQPKPPVNALPRRPGIVDRIKSRLPELDMYELRPQIMSGLTAGGLGGGGLYIAYSQYKAEQERRNQPSMDYEAFVAAIQDEMRREKGLPPTPSPKPALPMLAQ